jgi:hypothetical protein
VSPPPGWRGVRARRCRRCARRSRRGCGCGCSRCSVGIDAEALAGPDVGGGRHRGLAFGGWDSAADHPPPPCGSSPAPSPAGTPLRTFMGSSFRVARSAAVGIDAAAVSGAERGLRRHPPLPPLGSMAPPPPARMRVVAFMAGLRRWGPSRRRCRRRRGCVWWRSSRASAVGIEVNAVAGAKLGSSLHGSLSLPGGGGIRTTAGRPGRWRGRRRRGSACWCSSSFPRVGVVDQPPPSGLIAGPSPARMPLCIFIACSFRALRVSRWGRCTRPRRRAAACRCSSRAQPPWGSMPTPSPAGTPLWIFIVCSGAGLCAAHHPRGLMQLPVPARMRVRVLIPEDRSGRRCPR